MKLTLNIQDIKAPVFIEFLKSLDYVKIEESDSLSLSPEMKSMLDERLRIPIEECISREELKNGIKSKHGF